MLFDNFELMDSDLVLEVPDTPDRVPKLNNSHSLNSLHEDISTMEDKQFRFNQGWDKAEGVVSRHHSRSDCSIYNTDQLFHQASKARLLSEQLDSNSSPDTDAKHRQNGVSTKKKESVERIEPVAVSYPKNCREYRRKLVKETKSSDSELPGDQRNNKYLEVGSFPPPIRHPRSQRGLSLSREEKSIMSEGPSSVSRSRNEVKQACLSSCSHSMSEQETSNVLSTDKSCRALGVKKWVRNGCISPCNTTKSSSIPSKVHSHCGRNSSNEDKSSSSYLAGHLKIAEVVPKDVDASLFPNRMESEMQKTTLDISSRNKGKAIADGYAGGIGQIGKPLSSRSIRRHGLGINITRDAADDACLDSEDSVRTVTDKAHGVSSSKGVTISKGEESPSRQLKSSNEVDIRHNDCSTIVLDTPESARYPEGTRLRSTRGKRKYSTAIASGECSSSAPDDTEVSYLGTSLQYSRLRSPRTHKARGHSNALGSVIEVDDLLSPEVTSNNSREQSRMVSNPSSVTDSLSPEVKRTDSKERSRRVSNPSSVTNLQVESDELLARQLQEQLYSESPTIATRIEDEIDAALALSLQQEENAQSATSASRQTNHARRSRLLLPARAGRRLPSRSTMHFLRNHQVRSMNSTTMLADFLNDIDLRDMDFDSRLNFFEELEDAYDNRNNSDFSHIEMQHDFTEDDYEALLALDDNNHRHTGASRNQINNLPQSVVRTVNVDEPCAVCLENPAVGDTIRHLPCFHKFHKECIDEWLRRKTSCPVCKISIT